MIGVSVPGFVGTGGTSYPLDGSFGSVGFVGLGGTTLPGFLGSLSYGVGVSGVTPSGTFGTSFPTGT